MNNLQAIEILGKLRNYYKNGRPKWYETATDEEKKEYDIKNEERTEAFDLAINALKARNRLEKLNEQAQKASEFISELLKDFVDEGE